MTDPTTEKPEDKDLQDHRFGKKLADKAEQAEKVAAAGETLGETEETEHHAGGKA